MLRNNLLKNITVKLAEMINAKHAAIINPNQKHAVNANLYPNNLPKIIAVRKRTSSIKNITKISDLKYSQVGLVSFSNLSYRLCY